MFSRWRGASLDKYLFWRALFLSLRGDFADDGAASAT
jgi:hypothetical protein